MGLTSNMPCWKTVHLKDDRGPDTRYIGREICFSYNEDTLTIVDVTNKAAPVQLSRRGYSGAKYTHQGWLTDDRRHVIVDDELDETGAEKSKSHIFNVQSLTNPTYVGFHSGTTTAIDHNQYIKGDLVFQANFLAGLQVLRINNLETASLTQVGYFDIFPSSDSNLFDGAWGNYPYFPSGNIIVSGMGQGLYVLKSPNNFGLTPTTPSLYTAPITNMALSDKVIRHYYLDVTAGQTVSCSPEWRR
jgi:choice-of-anchor B domain-containing protein